MNIRISFPYTKVTLVIINYLPLIWIILFSHKNIYFTSSTNLGLRWPNQPEIEGHEYGYAIFKPLPYLNFSSNNSTSVSSVTVTNIETNDHSNGMVDNDEDNKIHLLFCPERVINMQNDDSFCNTITRLINEKKLSSSERYCVNDGKLLDKVVREDDKSFHALVVPQALIK